MTNRERVYAAIEHRQPDVTPYHVGFTVPAYRKMQEYFGDPNFEANLGNCLTIFSSSPANAWTETRPDVWRDAFGVEWDRSVDKDIGVVCNRLVTPENAADFPLPDPTGWAVSADLAAACAAPGERFLLVDLGFSLFERAWTLAGMPEVLMGMAEGARWVGILLDRILEFNLEVIERACRQPIDAMMFGDDWGDQRGVIMGVEHWRTFIRPRIARMYQAVRARGKFVFIHSCGKVDALFEDLADIGVQVFNPFQPEVMDVYEMKRRHGARLAFYGGISTQRTLPYGTTEATRDEVRRLLAEIGAGGGYIAAPAHAIPGDARPENIAAMIEELKGQVPGGSFSRKAVA
jgi:uroporphyrinogen decarboxylase